MTAEASIRISLLLATEGEDRAFSVFFYGLSVAGHPYAFAPAGISSLTKDIAPITARSPMAMPI
jgi:hypothetical protein